MKWLSQGVKVGILTLIGLIAAYAVWKTVGSRPSGKNAYPLYAKFRDASGLPVGSQVVIAGLPVGEITDLSIEGRQARIDFNVRGDVQVWSNAVVYKKTTSLLGTFYLEIDPGGEIAEDGSKNRLLKPGEQVPMVVEATTVEQLFRRVDQTLPRVDEALISIKDLSEDARQLVRGPIANIANRIDDLVQSESGRVASILERTDRSLARIEQITADIRAVSKDAPERVDKILDNLDQASAEAKGLVTSARKEVEDTGAKVREKLDMVDDLMTHTTSVAKKIDDDQGTLGRLVNDSTLADNLTDISDDAKGFLGTLFGMQTYVGLRSEYAFRNGGVRSYITVDINTRPDKFYYLELLKGPEGGYPDTSLTCGAGANPCQKQFVIRDRIRFTFQFGKRLGWAQFRYGIKESAGGVGMDTFWFNDRLKTSIDVFDASFDRLPRLKLAAVLEVFRHLYVLGGIDDALNKPDSIPIADDGFSVPHMFEEPSYKYGRDWFLGAQLRFNDKDLAALLFVGGAALAAAGSSGN